MSSPSAYSFATRSYRAANSQSSTADEHVGKPLSSVAINAYDDLGKTIHGRYRIHSLIGEGGMGVVYQAHDLQIDRQVAIKLIRHDCLADQKFVTRFRRELEITSQFRHPSTIRVYEYGETQYDGRLYMVMELLTGQSLAKLLETHLQIPELNALEYTRQIAESLSEAHEHEIFHRDLKPENLFIETVGISTIVKVLDFGIAGGLDNSRLTQAGEVFGTPEYMSPEQCNGHPLDHRTDIYSLGCILYEMIEGRPPFVADTPMATMLRHVRNKLIQPRNCHPQTAKLLHMALRKDRDKRIQSAGRFAKLIGDAIEEVRASQKIQSLAEESQIPAASIALPLTSAFTPSPLLAPATTKIFFENNGHLVIFALAAAAIILVGIFVSSQAKVSEQTEALSPKADATQTVANSPGAFPNTRPLITANISGASVLVDGVMQCQTPCEVEIPVGDNRSHEIRLVQDGYIDVVQNWRPTSVTAALPPFPPMLPVQREIHGNDRRRPRQN